MKRLRRIISNAITVLSLLLSLGTAGLWVRSYWVEDELEWPRGEVNERVGSTRGSLYASQVAVHPQLEGENRIILQEDGIRYRTGPAKDVYEQRKELYADTWLRFGGFTYFRGPVDQFCFERCVIVPTWAVFLALNVLPLLWLRSGLRRRRAKRVGRCINCGYDLRATPDRCPECGTIPLKAKG